MTKLQIAILGVSVLLLFVLYFGCNTKSPEIRSVEKTRSIVTEETNLNSLLQQARETFSESQLSQVILLDNELSALSEEDTNRVEVLKSLASEWYQLGRPTISAIYAQQVAEVLNTEDSWSIAGTTFVIAIQRSTDERIKRFARGRAVSSFENAISINPANVQHRVNLALCYTEYPLPDDPMKGVLMLRELNQEYPQNVTVLNTLARLAIKTGQYARAVERLEEALQYEKDNVNTICLLASAYEGDGQQTQAIAFRSKCQQLIGTEN